MKFLFAFLMLSVLLPDHSNQPLPKQDKFNRDSPAPDYSKLYYWSANPDKKNITDSIPAFINEAKTDKKVDVFFLHYTTYMVGTALNADIDDTELNNRTDATTVLYQATVFNGSCRIFAPRYRQALLKTFFDPDAEDSQEAFDLAYSDIRTAFQYYLDHYNHGRPIIIAGHSQGTFHAIKLLKEFFDGKPLQKQLVCAYLPGFQIKTNAFKSIPLGTSPTQTGCFVGWQTYKKGYDDPGLVYQAGNAQGINPVSWTASTRTTNKEKHLGLMTDFNKLYPHTITAKLDGETKALHIDLPPELWARFFNMQVLHGFDYNLFYMNIRKNVKQRIDAYLARH